MQKYMGKANWTFWVKKKDQRWLCRKGNEPFGNWGKGICDQVDFTKLLKNQFSNEWGKCGIIWDSAKVSVRSICL